MAKLDFKDLKLDELVGGWRDEATKRASDLIGDGRSQARRSLGHHDDSQMFAMFVGGVLIGALVGAAVALLMTPFTGNEARKRISERVETLRSSADDLGMGGGSNGRSVYHSPTTSSVETEVR